MGAVAGLLSLLVLVGFIFFVVPSGAIRILTGCGGTVCTIVGGVFLANNSQGDHLAGAVLAVGGLLLISLTGMPFWGHSPGEVGPWGLVERGRHNIHN